MGYNDSAQLEQLQLLGWSHWEARERGAGISAIVLVGLDRQGRIDRLQKPWG
jgi:hypothetical protein